MDARLVEHWLTSANELSYQLPFCEVLLAEGYDVLYVSTHGRGEHGKDVVARRSDGVLCSFQLKGGDIPLPEWRKIRGEVEELVRLPVRVPGISEMEPHVPHLVTNGELKGDGIENVQRFADTWVSQGALRLEVWQKDKLVKKFLDAHGTYLPAQLTDFRSFVELFVGAFTDPLPRAKFARLLAALVDHSRIGERLTQRARALSALAVVAGYVLEQYERASNHVAALEGWTIVAATMLRVVERDDLPLDRYRKSLDLVWIAFWRNLVQLESEVRSLPNFMTPHSNLAAGVVYGARVTITLGWLSAAQLIRARFAARLPGSLARPVHTELLEIIRREAPGLRFTGEVDWPYVMALGWYLEHAVNSAETEALLAQWIRWILTNNRVGKAAGVAPPYWSHERVFRKQYGMLAPHEHENFLGHSYTVMQALDMLVRRMRRQLVTHLWPSATHLDVCDFSPDNASEWFLWEAPTGALKTGHPPPTASWSEWRQATSIVPAAGVPGTLVTHVEWLLPLLLTYPQRTNRQMSAYADAVVGLHATVHH